jgi:SEC-C motif domain protein
MRSRYTAYVRGAIDYLVATHDATTRAGLDRRSLATFCRETGWLGLEIVKAERGGQDDSDDNEGFVEFIARGVTKGVPFAQRERSRFRKVDGRWFYVDGAFKQA